jgi:16S rRNA (cytosine967-C5)-methyltransferase
MKLHRNIATGIFTGLEATLIEKRPAADVIKRLLKSNRGWGSRDRRTIAKAFYDIIRQKRFFQALSNGENNPLNLWSLIGVWATMNDFAVPQWEEFKNLSVKKIRTEAPILIQERKYNYSLPDWLDQLGTNDLGPSLWEKEMCSLNNPADLIVRVNTLRTTVEKLKDILEKKYQIITRTIKGYDEALLFEKKYSLQDIKEYREGFFEVQDANSQKVAPWLDPQAGNFYLDACAGAGGKSLHLANLTKDTAKILALDIHPAKLDELRKRCLRNGIESVQTADVNDDDLIHSLKNMVDGVLIDAPCSGLGVLKRNPDTKWNIDSDRLEEIIKTQEKILQNYAGCVKKGGTLVYATCSIMPVENEHQIARFLESDLGGSFEFEKEHTYYSHQTGFDGFYCARLIRKM